MLKLDSRGRVRFTVRGIRFEVSGKKPSLKIYTRFYKDREELLIDSEHGYISLFQEPYASYALRSVIKAFLVPGVTHAINNAFALVNAKQEGEPVAGLAYITKGPGAGDKVTV
jgi:hypothetical protein